MAKPKGFSTWSSTRPVFRVPPRPPTVSATSPGPLSSANSVVQFPGSGVGAAESQDRTGGGTLAVKSPDPSVPTAGDKALEVENYTETYKVIAEWIRFADAKAGVTLTINGILLGLLLPTLKGYLAEKVDHPTAWWTILVVVLFLGWLLFLVLSAVSAFLCILPIRGTARILALQHTQHFHPAAVSQ